MQPTLFCLAPCLAEHPTLRIQVPLRTALCWFCGIFCRLPVCSTAASTCLFVSQWDRALHRSTGDFLHVALRAGVDPRYVHLVPYVDDESPAAAAVLLPPSRRPPGQRAERPATPAAARAMGPACAAELLPHLAAAMQSASGNPGAGPSPAGAALRPAGGVPAAPVHSGRDDLRLRVEMEGLKDQMAMLTKCVLELKEQVASVARGQLVSARRHKAKRARALPSTDQEPGSSEQGSSGAAGGHSPAAHLPPTAAAGRAAVTALARGTAAGLRRAVPELQSFASCQEFYKAYAFGHAGLPPLKDMDTVTGSTAWRNYGTMGRRWYEFKAFGDYIEEELPKNARQQVSAEDGLAAAVQKDRLRFLEEGKEVPVPTFVKRVLAKRAAAKRCSQEGCAGGGGCGCCSGCGASRGRGESSIGEVLGQGACKASYYFPVFLCSV